MKHDQNEYGFHVTYSQLMQDAWERGETLSERAIAGHFAISRSTLSRMRKSYCCPRGSSGLSSDQLTELRRGRRATSVTHPSGISTSRSAGS